MNDSKSIEKLRKIIIDGIPKFPNNKETKSELEKMAISTLLIHYLNWMSRYVSEKPRKVIIEPTVTNDPRWKALKPNIDLLLEKVRNGDVLTPYLSTKPHSRGYTPATAEKGPNIDRWSDKDFLLNTMCYHHFHLGKKLENKGHVERTDDVIFTKVTRETYTIIGIYNHLVFESTDEKMNSERERLWKYYQKDSVGTLIANSGHAFHIVRTAMAYSRLICEIDPKLKDREFLQKLYEGSNLNIPNKPKFEWRLIYSDLGLYEKKQECLFTIHQGFN